RNYTRVAAGARKGDFNPGFFDAGPPFSADCNVTETALRQRLKDAEPDVTLMLDTGVTEADVQNGTVRSLQLANGDTLTATIFVDATDLGDLLPMCRVSWFIGAEGVGDT